MATSISKFFVSALQFSGIARPECKPNALVDDYSKITPGFLPNDPDPKQFNLLGGDYGQAGAPFEIQTDKKQVEITIGSANVGQPEPEANPGTAPTTNYWFAKFDQVACFDLTGYSAIQFDLIAPAGVDANFTMTQKSADCKSRLVDSVYTPLTKYITPDGTKKTVTLPLSDFSKNLVGGDFDFAHLKDWTIVNLKPVGAKIQISNMVLVGCQTSASAPTASGSSTATASTTRSAQATQTSNSAQTASISLFFTALALLF